MDKTEKGIIWYSSLLIALMLNSGKLFALKENGFWAQYWNFDLAEYLVQLLLCVIYCVLFFYLNLHNLKRPFALHKRRAFIAYVGFNLLFFLAYSLVSGILQYRLFLDNHHSRAMFWAGHLGRFTLSTLFAGIITKIILLIKEGKLKEQANEQLKSAYLEAELEVLKEQINPHFLFNSLTSLSGIVREDSELAQHYINHLARVFRYALVKPGTTLVNISDELIMLTSYQELLKMRFEEAILLDVNIADRYMSYNIPHLSLQPLLENAAKHNQASLQCPLKVSLYVADDWLVVINNLQPLPNADRSTGIGLYNLNKRYRILMNAEIEIQRTADSFIVKLPLKK